MSMLENTSTPIAETGIAPANTSGQVEQTLDHMAEMNRSAMGMTADDLRVLGEQEPQAQPSNPAEEAPCDDAPQCDAPQCTEQQQLMLRFDMVAERPQPHFDLIKSPDETGENSGGEKTPEPSAADSNVIAQDEKTEQAETHPVGQDGHAAVKNEQPFNPAWEVDTFRWPELCHRLLETKSDSFAKSGEKLKGMVQAGEKRIAIVAAHPGDGATTLALCFAKWALQRSVRVALVDADFDDPQVGARLGLEAPCSWHHALAGNSSMSETAVTELNAGLMLVPLQANVEFDPDVLLEAKTKELIDQVAGQADLVLIDAGRLSSVSNSSGAPEAVMPFDAVVVVHDARRDDEQQITRLCERIRGAGVETILLAENYSSHGG